MTHEELEVKVEAMRQQLETYETLLVESASNMGMIVETMNRMVRKINTLEVALTLNKSAGSA